MLNEKGQLILTLILVMTVALAIGLSVVQKSLVDVSTATKVEQSSRAFSAAEAGIEQALKGNASPQDLGNSASITEISDSGLMPCIPGATGCTQGSGTQQVPLEYDSLLGKEDVGHVWLADYNSTNNPPDAGYTQSSLDVYWGNSTQDKAALELTLVYYDGSQYLNRKWYLDQISRNPPNNFYLGCGTTTSSSLPNYTCKFTLGGSQDSNGPLPSGLMLLRARLLYNTQSQPFAVQAVGTCGTACSTPPQKRVIISTGVSGETQRRVKFSQFYKVVPPYFDYAIFSAGEIKK